MSNLSGHKRSHSELSPDIMTWQPGPLHADGWTELYFANREIDSLRKQLAEKTEELAEFKKHLTEMDHAYNEKLEEIDRMKLNAIMKKTKYNEVMTENAIKNTELFELHRELLFYKSKNPGNQEFDPEFFDDASAAWKANKKSKGNGEYEYKKK